jgi:hypothetical protein
VTTTACKKFEKKDIKTHKSTREDTEEEAQHHAMIMAIDVYRYAY